MQEKIKKLNDAAEALRLVIEEVIPQQDDWNRLNALSRLRECVVAWAGPGVQGQVKND